METEMGRACSTSGVEERCIQKFRVETLRRRPLGIPKLKCEDNIKMDLRGVGWGHGLDVSDSGEGHVAGCCEYGNELSDSITCREFD
jgi:hypothetical protein